VKSDHQRDAYVEDLSVIVISAKSAWRQVRFGGWLSAQAGLSGARGESHAPDQGWNCL